MVGVFFVTQGKTYPFEERGGYIWAPRYGVKESSIDHRYSPKFFWENLTLVKQGDIIVHYAGALSGGIKAISRAETDCYEAPITKELAAVSNNQRKGIGDWAYDGWRVDCDYVKLFYPIPIATFSKEILKYRRKNKGARSAFNQSGGVCQGYLYELECELAYIFLEKAVDTNYYLKDQSFIMNFLEDFKQEEGL